MARSIPPEPKWRKPAEDAVTEFVDQFKARLKRITGQIARHARADSIDRRHVEEAFDVVDRYGSRQLPFYKTRLPEILMFASVVFLELGKSVPDFFPLLFDMTRRPDVVLYMIPAVVLLGALSGALFVAAWFCRR